MIKASFSAVAADNKSCWFNVTSAPGIGTVAYFPLTYPNTSFALANVYSKIQLLPTELIFE